MHRVTTSIVRVDRRMGGFAWLFLIVAQVASLANAEVPERSRADLDAGAAVIIIGTCEAVDSTTKRVGQHDHTAWVHQIRVESVERSPVAETAEAKSAPMIAIGDLVRVHSGTQTWRGKGHPPPGSAGHRGMPAVGERRSVYATVARDPHGVVTGFGALFPNGWQPVPIRATLVGADDEYRSEITMPLLAGLLAREADLMTSVAFPADPARGTLDLGRRDHIQGLDALDRADVGVFFLRWRELDAPNRATLERFLRSGRPLVGVRTSTHMIRGERDGEGQSLDDEIPERVFGQRWISHLGHETKTRVLPPKNLPQELANHPILRGIRGDFVVPGWLYMVDPLPAECTVLLWGEAVGGADGATQRQPILWVREASEATPTPYPDGGVPARRMAFTTLGHPGDFEQQEVRRLFEQMVLWAAGAEKLIPPAGLPAQVVGAPFVAPATR